MMKVYGLTKRAVCCLVAAIVLCTTMVGYKYFPEATFQLANDSRLPRWFKLPPELSRRDVSLTMSYHIDAHGREANFVLSDQRQHILAKVNGKLKSAEPLHLNSSPQSVATDYPSFEVVTANGVTEIIEHKKMEPTFYITDDPAVRRKLVGAQPLH